MLKTAGATTPGALFSERGDGVRLHCAVARPRKEVRA